MSKGTSPLSPYAWTDTRPRMRAVKMFNECKSHLKQLHFETISDSVCCDAKGRYFRMRAISFPFQTVNDWMILLVEPAHHSNASTQVCARKQEYQ